MTDPAGNRPYHQPVLLAEVLAVLQPGPGRRYFDGTFGGGGHSRALLEAGASVVAGDRDPDALGEARALFARYGERFCCLQTELSAAVERLAALRLGSFDGVLLDLGVSSHQLDVPERGFSFAQDGPLDMRMNPQDGPTAADLLADADEVQLADWFWRLGEEPAARRVAARIVRERTLRPLRTTTQLASLVAAVVPRRGPRHPATRVFQALRMAVNRELDEIAQALSTLRDVLTPGGRLAVITFHSLEDRLVKNYLRDLCRQWDDRPEWPAPRPNPLYGFRQVGARPVTPSEAEISRNPRARSAKLRIVERLRHEP